MTFSYLCRWRQIFKSNWSVYVAVYILTGKYRYICIIFNISVTINDCYQEIYFHLICKQLIYIYYINVYTFIWMLYHNSHIWRYKMMIMTAMKKSYSLLWLILFHFIIVTFLHQNNNSERISKKKWRTLVLFLFIRLRSSVNWMMRKL